MMKKFNDLRNFVYVVWKFLGLPEPTPVQYSICEFLQEPHRRIIIEGYRGVGKSFLTAAYTLHQLLLNPQKNILVVSASKSRADDFSTFCLRLINEMDILAHLRPSEDQRQSKLAFDVRPARAAQQPSVKSLGISSQLTGSRADLIVCDDGEVPNLVMTHSMREKLSEQIKEFESILKPTDDSKIVFLGTPQTEQTIYNKLPERGYLKRVWCARYPNEKQRAILGKDLAPLIRKELGINPDKLIGKPTDPKRFNDEELTKRELSYGRTAFEMQFMLNTSLSDDDRFPLKIKDLIVMGCNPDNAPEKVIWASNPENRLENLPNVARQGDHFYQPMQIVGDWMPYQVSVLAIDPSGRGKNESGYTVAKMFNGNVYILENGGLEGYTDKTLKTLSEIAKKHKVNEVVIESNFGDGIFMKMLNGHLQKIFPVTVSEVRHSKQKEMRICDTLEALMNSHRLIVDSSVIENDYNSCKDRSIEAQLKYQLIFQLTRITRDRNSLPEDDRLDSLAMAVAYMIEYLNKDQETAVDDRLRELRQQSLDKFMETAIGVKPKEKSWINW